MPRHGSWRLDELSDGPIDIACRVCDRRGRYHRARLLERFGPDFALPDLPAALAYGCPKLANKMYDRCGAYIVTDTAPR